MRALLALPMAFMLGCAARERPTLVAEDIARFQPGTYERLDEAVESAGEGRLPAIALAVWRGDGIVFERYEGRRVPDDADSPRIGPDSLFDLASLTKPMAGVPLGVALAERGGSDVAGVLAHATSCEDAELVPRLLEARSATAIVEGTADCALVASSYQYSNAAYARIGAEWGSLESAESALKPAWIRCGARSLTFRPDADQAVVSGTDRRGEWLAGRPFDPLADWMLGLDRAPTHSGLFGTAPDVARFGGFVAAGGLAILTRDVAERRDAESGRNLWVTAGGLVSPTDPPFAAVNAQPGRFVMQTGYTGCLLWIDTRERTSVALLTNAAAMDARDEFDALSERVVSIILQGYER